MPKALRCFIAVLALGVPAHAQVASLAPEKAAAVDRAVAAQLTRQQVVGVAIGVLQDGQIVYLKGYGQADREAGTKVTTNTVFNWASNSKPLAAVAAMQLVERKSLDLDANIRTYVPEFPDTGSIITARHLLCHQSGIPHYNNGKVIGSDGSSTSQPVLDPVLALKRFDRSPLLFSPGEKVSYSSYAYILLSAVIERAGKQAFVDQIQQRIARPLGMESLQLDGQFANQPNWSAGYIKTRDGKIVRAPDEANDWKYGAGGYKSNVRDFARWANALLSRSLLGEQAVREMWTVQKISAGEPSKWGLGFTVEYQSGLKISHNGGQREVATRMVLYPDKRHGVVVMCNSSFANIGAFSTAVYSAMNADPMAGGN